MDDTQLLRQLAQVMGWEVVGPEVPRKARYDFSGPHVYVGPDGSLWRGVKANGDAQLAWRPLSSMDDAMQVVGRFRSYALRTDSLNIHKHRCTLWGDGVTPPVGHSGPCDTPQRAIALAALAALETREEGNT